MLFHQPFDLEECRQQIPFVSGRVDRVCKTLIVVKWLQKSIEWIPSLEIRSWFNLPRLGMLVRLGNGVGLGRALAFRGVSRRLISGLVK